MKSSAGRRRPAWGSLGVRLFASYVIVVAMGIGVLIVAASLATPSFFEVRMMQMMNGSGAGRAPGLGMMGAASPGGSPMLARFDAALAEAFRASLGQGLLVAGAAALLAAVGASLVVSRRLSQPIHQLARASRGIAEGRYSQRVDASGPDELAELGASFNAMAAALETTERRRMELIGDVAHELRTPITTLRGYLEGLIDGVVQPSDHTWARLQEEAGRMQRLVDDLQELSRAEARQLSLHPRTLSVPDLVRAAADRFRSTYLDKAVALDLQVPPDVPAVLADADRVLQVLSNLLTNALRYTPAGGHVGVRVSQPRADEVLVEVCDTGIGIPPPDLPHVFERFYRVDKSRSRALGGSGIGLTIARAVVEAMGGRMWADSKGVDQGSTFRFTLPVAT